VTEQMDRGAAGESAMGAAMDGTPRELGTGRRARMRAGRSRARAPWRGATERNAGRHGGFTAGKRGDHQGAGRDGGSEREEHRARRRRRHGWDRAGARGRRGSRLAEESEQRYPGCAERRQGKGASRKTTVRQQKTCAYKRTGGGGLKKSELAWEDRNGCARGDAHRRGRQIFPWGFLKMSGDDRG
jgi:hypothetical protein